MPIIFNNPAIMKCVYFLLILLIISSSSSDAKHEEQGEKPVTISHKLGRYINAAARWRDQHAMGSELKPTPALLVAGALSFLAAAISSSGGIGGGGLFLPILTIVAGFDLKTASSFTAFMVTGVSIANVACNMISLPGGKNKKKALIDYDIALLWEPCVLLGVSIGVICSVVFPEWLITIMFTVFLAWSTFKTLRSGVRHWKRESESMMMRENMAMDKLEEPLLSDDEDSKTRVPWMKIGLLVVIWLCFFLINLFHGDQFGQGIISIKPCGVEYWAISATQIPLAIIFTSCIMYIGRKRTNSDLVNEQELGNNPRMEGPGQFVFPVMALLAGALSGLFGIGGGMLISPMLLQVGISPEITSATCSFMVLFSSTMSAFQFLLLGMDQVYSAVIFALVCFTAAMLGMKVVQRAVVKHGRASLIVFSVGTVMAVSTILMSSFGVVDVWKDYTRGNYMGFKLPC